MSLILVLYISLKLNKNYLNGDGDKVDKTLYISLKLNKN